jgi:hypothetical protein
MIKSLKKALRRTLVYSRLSCLTLGICWTNPMERKNVLGEGIYVKHS